MNDSDQRFGYLPKRSYDDYAVDGFYMVVDSLGAIFLFIVHILWLIFGWPFALLSWLIKHRE